MVWHILWPVIFVRPFLLNADICFDSADRKCKHIKVAEATGGQILAYQISVFPIDLDQLLKHITAHGQLSLHEYFHQGLIYARFPLSI